MTYYRYSVTSVKVFNWSLYKFLTFKEVKGTIVLEMHRLRLKNKPKLDEIVAVWN